MDKRVRSNDITLSSDDPLSPLPTVEHRFPSSRKDATSNPYVYMAVYCSVPVYEMMVRGVAVMRRRSDSFMNATQILKVAGVEKSKRSRILDREIIQGVHEKIQGGYGRYQGTWVPFSRAHELAVRLGVAQSLAPLLNILPGPDMEISHQPTDILMSTKPSSTATHLHPNKDALTRQSSRQSLVDKREWSTNSSPSSTNPPEAGPSKKSRLNTHGQSNGNSNVPSSSIVEQTLPITEPFIDHPYTHFQPEHAPEARISSYHPVAGPSATPCGGSSFPRKSNPPSRSHLDDPSKIERNVKALMSVVANPSDADEHETRTSLLNSNIVVELNEVLEDPELDIDSPIDEHCNTALHWVASLARLNLVRGFLKSGADVNRGNDAGETPLMRATLATNNFERESFNQLLELLHPSLWTLDNQDRTLLHHICLTANTKGRAESSRYHLECIFEWIVNKHGGQFESQFIDAVDLNGDTALNIAARVGNKHLVRMLLDVGADKTIGNNLGLKPSDFGVEGEETSTSHQDVPVAPSRRTITSVPAPTSRDIIASINSLVSSLSEDFEQEIRDKKDCLENVRVKLKVATRQLAEQRHQLEWLKHDLDERALLELRLKKLRAAVVEEDGFDWTGRSELDGRPAQAGKSFEQNGIGSTIASLSASQIQMDLEPDPFMPQESNIVSLIHLRRMEKWYIRVLALLRERIGKMKGCNLEQEAKYLKVIGSFIGNTGANEITGMQTGISATSQPQFGSSGSATDHNRPTQNDVHNPESLSSRHGQVEVHSKSTPATGASHTSYLEPHSSDQQLQPPMIDGKLLTQLMAAIESDGPELDLNRVAGFLQRVQSGLL